MKILLVQPPYKIYKHEPKGCQPPLGLAYIAAVLEKDYEMGILDCVVEGYDHESPAENDMIVYGLPQDEIKKRIEDFNPDIVGVSCLFSTQSKNMHAITSTVKSISDGIKVVVGGAHASACPDQVMKDKNVDYVIIGEGELSFQDLCASISSEDDSCKNIDGIAFRSDDKTVINPKSGFIDDLDSLPLPARHLLPMEKYFEINSPHGTVTKYNRSTPVITSRGCPMKCIFCSIHTVWGRKFRARSAIKVFEELKMLKEEYGIREVQFEDDNLTLNKRRAKEIFRLMIDGGLDIIWTTPNGLAAYTIDEELVALMKESGCQRACLAIESGDQDTLDNIVNKPVKLHKMPETISYFRKYGIAPDAFFVVGFPGETKEKIKKTFKYARSLDLENINFFVATPYPGTELDSICRTNNYIDADFDIEKARVGEAHISTPDFSSEELHNMIRKENLLIRLRLIKNPKVFYERIIKRFIKDPRFVLNYLKNKVLK